MNSSTDKLVWFRKYEQTPNAVFFMSLTTCCSYGLRLACVLSCRGEDYKLFWPEKGEFVRLAVDSGAIIVPFSAVGIADRYTSIIAGISRVFTPTLALSCE